MTGVDCPGKLALQSGAFASIFSGSPVSREVPFWSGPRQLSHPVTPPGAAAGATVAAGAGLAGAVGAGFLGAA